MNKIARDRLYNKVYDEFLNLIKGNIKEVIITPYEIYELDQTYYYTDVNGLFVRQNSYLDALSNAFKNKNVIQTKDIITGNYIYRLEGVSN